MPVLVDEMDNAVWLTYGPAPNIAYLIGTDGRIVAKQSWYQPEQMEVVIDSYIKDERTQEDSPIVSEITGAQFADWRSRELYL